MREDPNGVRCPKCLGLNPEDTKKCVHCGAFIRDIEKTLTYASPPYSQDSEKTIFNSGEIFAERYRIIEEIGRGGMGRVYKAKDLVLDITVALKIIRPEQANKSKFIELFKQETLLGRSISHENVIRIHDIGEEQGIKYISMDYIEGQNLKELIHTSGSLTIATTINFAQQICQALRVAHQKNIIHRDLKPHNIMVNKSGKVVTMDFGLAALIDPKNSKVEESIAGTPQYISPEQAKGESVDQRTDVYALGLIMYEMATGKRAFKADSIKAYLEKHIHERPPLPSLINPLVPHSLDRIIMKCLEKNRVKRYQTVDDVCRDLSKIKSAWSVEKSGRIKQIKNIMSYVLAVLFIGVVSYLLFWKKSDIVPELSGSERKAVAVMYFENRTNEDSLDYLSRFFQGSLIMDLFQSKFLRIIPEERILAVLDDPNTAEKGPFSMDVLDKIADEEKVDFFILGEYGKMNDDINLSIRIVDSKNQEEIGNKSMWRPFSKIMDMVDECTPWIKQKMQFTIEELNVDIDKELKKYSTDNPEALMHFINGMKFYRQGDYQKSIEALDKALDIDENFAMADSWLGILYIYRGYPEKGKEHILKALDMKDSLTLRERYLIQALYYYIYETAFDKATEAYQDLLDIYPEDEEALENMGGLYRNIEEWDKSQSCFRKLIEINPKSEIACGNLIEIYKAKGSYDDAIIFLEQHRDSYIHQNDFYQELAFIYLLKKKYNQALVEAGKSLTLDPISYRTISTIGHIYHLTDDFSEAEKEYAIMMSGESSYYGIIGRCGIGWIDLTQGRFNESLNLFDEALKAAQGMGYTFIESGVELFRAYIYMQLKEFPKALSLAEKSYHIAVESGEYKDVIQALHYIGSCQLEMGNIEEAEKCVSLINGQIEKTGYRKLQRHSDHLLGMMALSEKDYKNALLYFEKSCSTLPLQHDVYDNHAFFLEAMASAYFQVGELEKARSVYEQILSLTTGRLNWGNIYSLSFYKLGVIYNQLGMRMKAVEYLQKFKELWSKADPDLPELKEAEHLLAGIDETIQD